MGVTTGTRMEIVVDGVRLSIESSVVHPEDHGPDEDILRDDVDEQPPKTTSLLLRSSSDDTGKQQHYIDFSNFTGRLHVVSSEVAEPSAKNRISLENDHQMLPPSEGPSSHNDDDDEEHHERNHLTSKSRPFRHSTVIESSDDADDRSLESFDAERDTLELHNPVSPLHMLCASPTATLPTLIEARDAQPSSVLEPDKEGQFPLHVLSQNTRLLARPEGRRDATEFCILLVDQYLDAMTFKDAAGHFPFQRIIEEWVDGTYRNAVKVQPSSRGGKSSALRHAWSGLTASWHGDAAGSGSNNKTDDEINVTEHAEEHESSSRGLFWSRSASFLSRRNSSHLVEEDEADTSIGGPHAYKLFPYAVLPSHVEWAFTMLSTILIRINAAYANKQLKRDEVLFVWVSLTKALASIPYLLKTILLIEQDETRRRLLRECIVQRVLLSSRACGRWLCPMLHRRGVSSHRAVDYFVEVSKVTVTSYVGPKRTPRSQDFKDFETDRAGVFAMLGSISRVIPSLAVLDQKETERAGATDAVWDIVSRSISRPIVVGILALDLLFHMVLLFVFRFDISHPTFDLLEQFDEPWQKRVSDAAVVSICIYFLLRKTSEVFALLRISKRAFRAYSLDFWNMIDVSAIILPLVSCTLHDNYPGVFAFTMATLWLRLLGLLKAINMELATFILAIMEIFKDIRWFLVVLTIFILMFGDMIHIITLRSDSDYCSDKTAPAEFCSETTISLAYLKLYSVIVGDVGLEDFSYSPAVAFLFCIFMLLGFIVLLNVLIAIVSDSYEKSVIRAKFLFGRARVGFAVTHVAQEQFLQGTAMPPFEGVLHSLCDHEFSLWVVEWIGRWTMLACMVWTFAISEMYLIMLGLEPPDKGSPGLKVVSMILIVLLSILLFVAMTLVLQNLFHESLDRMARCLHLTALNDSINSILHYVLQFITEQLLGIHHATGLAEKRGWHGKFEFLENTMHRLLSSTEQKLSSDMLASEQRIKTHGSQVGEDVKIHTEQTFVSSAKAQES